MVRLDFEGLQVNLNYKYLPETDKFKYCFKNNQNRNPEFPPEVALRQGVGSYMVFLLRYFVVYTHARYSPFYCYIKY